MPKQRTTPEQMVQKRILLRQLIAQKKNFEETKAAITEKFGSGISSSEFYRTKANKAKPSSNGRKKGAKGPRPEVEIVKYQFSGEKLQQLAAQIKPYLTQQNINSITIHSNGLVELTRINKDTFSV